MKNFLATTAVLEFATGLALLALPSAVAAILLGTHLDTPVGLTVARLAGVALLAIATACWFARPDHQSRVVMGLACAMLAYNFGASAIFVQGTVMTTGYRDSLNGHGRPSPAHPSLRPTRYGWLRQPSLSE